MGATQRFEKVRFVLLCVPIAVGLGGCAANLTPTSEELRAIEQPSAADVAWLDAVAPKATKWFLAQEASLVKRGRPLTAEETELARRMGVRRPEMVRVLVLAGFPLPDDPELSGQVKALGFGSDDAGGFSMGYAVLVKPRFQSERWLLAHELVHVSQRERLGSETFIRRYLLELRTVGYSRSPLEMEANRKMAEK
jgi:hypothetical protein